MNADRERRVAVVGEHALPARLFGQRGNLGSGLERQRELTVAAPDGLSPRGDPEPPQQLAARAPVVAGACGDERLQYAVLHLRAPREVAEVAVRPTRLDRRRIVLA